MEKYREEKATEDGDRVKQPQSRELMGLPEAGRAKKDSTLEGLEGAWLCQHIDFQTWTLQSY